MSSLVPKHFQNLRRYIPGKPPEELRRELGLSKIVKLASNENPWGTSPKALTAIENALQDIKYYPDASGYYLKKLLCEMHNLKEDNIMLANGSEGIMACIVRTFLVDDDEILTSDGSFVGFYILGESTGKKLIKAPMRDKYWFNLEKIADLVTKNTKIIYLANPNNPTGTIFTKEEFDNFYKKIPERVLIILDEAYYEYAKEFSDYPDSLHYRYDNVITLRTFSKAYGLAGLRIGYGTADKPLMHELHKIRLPFEPNTLAQVAACAALEDKAHLEKTIQGNSKNRVRLKKIMENHFQVETVPSYANFIMVEVDSETKVDWYFNELMKKGVIIRGLKPFGWPKALRISVGTNEELDFLENALKDLR